MRLFTALLALPLLAAPQNEDGLLAAIRQKMRENLAHLPNYTCRLTIERSTRPAGSRRYRPVDTVHMEVGLVAGTELYAWPGQKFESQRLDEMMPAGGAVGTGDFALHVHSIFVADAATFRYAGRGAEDGREVVRFEYRVPRSKSRYLLQSGTGAEFVGYGGSFSADAGTLALVRLEIVIEQIPPELRISRAQSRLTYAPARIGGQDFLLPHSSELTMADAGGGEERNLTRFENCRQYQGEAVVSFTEPAAAAEAPKAIAEIRLPADLLVEMTLVSDLFGERAAIGDPIAAAVSRDVVKAGKIIIPKGAKVTGRITRIGRWTGGRVPYQFAGIRMSTIEFGGSRAEFTGSLESMAVAGGQVSVARADRQALERGASMLFVKGNLLHIPAGVHMIWRTL
jgi:hypothetical protein